MYKFLLVCLLFLVGCQEQPKKPYSYELGDKVDLKVGVIGSIVDRDQYDNKIKYCVHYKDRIGWVHSLYVAENEIQGKHKDK
jgi:hypothetical protein